MSIGLNYKDTITIIDYSNDVYGDETSSEQSFVKSLFLQSTGQSHGGNVDSISTSAHAYVNPFDPFIVKNANRLEGMLVVANPFGAPETESWYRISKVIVGMDKLLCNKIDNVHIYLKKSTEIPNGLQV